MEDSMIGALDKGKGILKITQGESEAEETPKGPTLTIEHISSAMLLVGGIKIKPMQVKDQ
jgi:hypothetical protein